MHLVSDLFLRVQDHQKARDQLSDCRAEQNELAERLEQEVAENVILQGEVTRLCRASDPSEGELRLGCEVPRRSRNV